MKPTPLELTHNLSNVTEKVRMEIDQESLVHLMGVLTDLYSDPALAVIREYSTNALDSNIDAGNTDPIKVKLPTLTTPFFVVQDQGLGLSVDDLRDVYSMYGKSTKRDSDDVAGMLGLGCKSGLTYAPSFTVEAIKNGVKTVATVAKDDDGVGTIKILDTASTNDKNGVTIKIPVPSHTIQNFIGKAEEFYKYWRPGTVLVDNKTPEFFVDPVWLDDDIAILRERGKSRIVMGNVPYPFDPKVGNVPLQYSVVAYVPMGSVNFPPSREALQYTRRTEETIKTLIDYVKDRLPQRLEELFDTAPTPFEKMKLALHWNYSGIANWAQKPQIYHIELPKDRPAWRWGHTWNSRANKVEGRIHAQSLSDIKETIITGFPVKVLGPSHRERLTSLGLGGNQQGYDKKSVLLLPDNADISILEGRPNMMTWDEVLNKTPLPKRGNGPRTKTLYTYTYKGRTLTEETVPDDKPIVYYRVSEVTHTELFPEAQFIRLYANQVDRFVRLHPTALSDSEYRNKRIKDMKKKMVESDKILHCLPPYTRQLFSSLKKFMTKPTIDPRLQKIIDACGKGESDDLKLLKRLYAVEGIEAPGWLKDTLAEYPLLTKISQPTSVIEANDVCLYFNTKHKENS